MMPLTPTFRLPARAPAGRPLIALHASGASGRQWRPLAEAIDGTHLVVAPDLHGHGRGPAPPSAPGSIVLADASRIATMARSVPGGVHLVGHSYGAAVALRVARDHPCAVRSLLLVEPVDFRVLFDVHGRRPPAAEVHEVASTIARHVDEGFAGRAAQRFVEYWGGGRAWNAMDDIARATTAARMPAIASQFEGLARHAPSLAECGRLSMPVLLIAGSRTREPAARIVDLLAGVMPDARVQRLDGGDHLEALVSPARIISRIAEFLADVDVARASRWAEAA